MSTDRNRKQFVDLGSHPEAYMTRGTCGDTGGAVSFWVKIVNCTGTRYSGIITTLPMGVGAGLLISCVTEDNRDETIE